MNIIKLLLCGILLCMILAISGTAQSENAGDKRIPWTLTVVLLDGTDPKSQARRPVEEAVKFIEDHSRFSFTVTYVESPAKHDYTPYLVGKDKNRDGKPDDKVWAMMGWNVPPALIRRLPVSSSYLFLYKLYRRVPAQAGSALGLDFGLIKGGKPRPYATAPVDQRWFINEPNQGFQSWAAQVLAHEIVNTIQAKLEARPYRCGQLKGTAGVRSDRYESERLASITAACYKKLGNNAN